MGPLSSANIFQKIISNWVHVLHGLIHNIWEVYIDNMLIFGSNEDNLLANTWTVFQWGSFHHTYGPNHNLLFMNNHGFRKVLQWKFDIQYYDPTIEHVAGKANISADVFSRLIV